MEFSARRPWRQQGGVRRGVAGGIAGSVLVVMAVIAFRAGPGGVPAPSVQAGQAPVQATATAGPAHATAGMQAVQTGMSPRQLAVPYAYEDHGQQVFALEPRMASTNQDDTYPAPVRMNREAAERAATTGSMEATLPDGTRYPVVFERVKQGPKGNMTWVGRVASPIGDLAAVLTYGRDGVFGVLPTPEGQLLQVKTRNGQAYLEPDPGIIPPGVDPEAPFPDYVLPPPSSPDMLAAMDPSAAMSSPAPTRTGMAAPTDGTLSEITVLGVYTTNLVTERGSVAAAETEFINLLEISNQAHIDSGTTARFTLAGLLETDYPGAISNTVVLGDLYENRMRDGLDIHAQRDAHGADLVALLRPYASGDTTCGIAYVGGAGRNGTNAHDSVGYSVTACGSYTMAHEIGHNLGSQHDRETATDNGLPTYGAFDFSFGYRQSNTPSFATIMAYAQDGQPWIGYFSAPDNVSCLGAACGVQGLSDNVRSINLMAETISRFRDPPNTISVLDAKVIEPFQNTAALRFTIRLSSPAPAGGVQFDIATVSGGTATAGSDYVPRSITREVIPEGLKEGVFLVDVLPDGEVEGDETVHVRLSNVIGMQVHDDEAVGVILDDDPRVWLSGSLVFPDGDSGPDMVVVKALQTFQGSSETLEAWAMAPDYRFEFPVMAGAQVRLDARMSDSYPWIDGVAIIDRVEKDMALDLNMERAVRVNGKVTWPEGAAAPQAPINVVAWRDVHGVATGRVHEARPPDFTYSIKARSGTSLGLDLISPPAPYVRQRVETFPLGDIVQDVALSTVPSLAIQHQWVEEGAAGSARTVRLRIRLSVPAPPEGVTFDLVTEDGTASGESDYLPESRSITISEGSTFLDTSVVVFGDNRHEPDEYFKVVARNIRGAHMPTPGVVWIANDDPPGQAAGFDFDGDGRSDLVWRHAGSGRGALWGGAQDVRYLVTVADTDWQIANVGDFDSDGRADLFWRHARTGANVIWRGGDHTSQLRVRAVTDVNWKVAGIGDFDGDGQSDVLWRNARTGANVIWRGADYRAQVRVTGVTDPDWQVASVGDFDGDGRSDILWRHARTGRNTIWRQGDYRNQQSMLGVTDTRWTIAGTGDFDGDGIDDVLWRHGGTGSNVIWRSAGHVNQKPVTAVTNLDWQVAAVGDYDGDGLADIAWRDRKTGANVVWRAGSHRSQMKMAQVSDQRWSVVP